MRDILKTCAGIEVVDEAVVVFCEGSATAERLAKLLTELSTEADEDAVTCLSDHVPFLLKASELPGFDRFFVDYFLGACAKSPANWIIARNLTCFSVTAAGKALNSLATQALLK